MAEALAKEGNQEMSDSSEEVLLDLEALGTRVLNRVKPMLLQDRKLSVAVRSQMVAVCNWLGRYRAPVGATQKEQVQGFLEAFYHCCEGGSLEAAQIILSVCVDKKNNTTFIEQLGKWGLYAEQIEAYKRILALLADEDGSYLSLLGRAYYAISDYSAAHSCYERSLAIAQASGNRFDQMVAIQWTRVVARCERTV